MALNLNNSFFVTTLALFKDDKEGVSGLWAGYTQTSTRPLRLESD